MAGTEAVRRVMHSGSASRMSHNAVARNIMLPTIDILGPERSLRDLHSFVDTVSKVGVSPPRLALYGMLQSGELQERREQYFGESLFPGTKYFINLEREEVAKLAKAESIRMLGREIGRDALVEMVELQVSGDVAHRRVELLARNVNPVPTYTS